MAHIVRQSGNPDVWAVRSYRAGENSQIIGLAEALGAPFEEKRLVYKPTGALGNLTRRVGLFGIDRRASSPLAPPWPKLIISAGLRNEPVCRWIAKQSEGRTRLVFLGRTWAPRSEFDLIVTTPQYRLPDEDGVLHNLGTLHRVTEPRLVEAAEVWKAQLNPEDAPTIAVLIGGRSGPVTFGTHAANRLASLAQARAEKIGAKLLVTSSSRTDPRAIDMLAAHLPKSAHVHRFGHGENPYFGVLALADEIIVTSDSIAMLSEACATGKPVWIFDLGAPPRDKSLATELYRALVRFGPKRLSRDLALVHESFIARDLAAWLEADAKPASGGQTQDVQRAVAYIRELLAASWL
ncbi:MAG: ELM1/GtrOC1 family putative glycosyltransferase [Gammaproteobacteria bacterium]|nr:ELM1/GtrOC1 family putative glycosyltransferase [Gammaproteobacteria bacterium]